MAEPTLKILGLAGEYRASSKSGMLVNEALNMAAARGAEVVFWDLAAQPLPWLGRMAVGPIQTSRRFKRSWNRAMRFSSPLLSIMAPCLG